MFRYILLMLLVSGSAAYPQSYEISVFGSDITGPAQSITLYRHSANLGEVTVTDRQKNKIIRNINLRTDQGKTGKKNNLYLIEPGDSSSLLLKILKGKKEIGHQSFRVADPPEPSIEFVTSGKKSLHNGFIVGLNDTLSFDFTPDSAYVAMCPEDINYKATEITVVQNGNVRNPRPIGGEFKLNSFGLNSGETIKLEINRYQRKNYKGETFIEKASPEDFLILKIK